MGRQCLRKLPKTPSPRAINLKEVTELKAKLKQSEEKCITLEKHQETLRSIVNNHKEKGEAHRVIVENFEQKVRKLESSLADKEEQIRMHKVEIDTQKSLAVSFMDEIQVREEGRINEAPLSSSELEAANIVIVELETDNKALQQKVETIYEKNLDLEDSLQTLSKEKSALKAKKIKSVVTLKIIYVS